MSYEEWQAAWRETLGVNLIGAANVTWCAVQHMIAGGGGRIVNVSSRGAFRGEPGQPAYGASKAGLNAFGQSLARDLAPHGIAVATVAPGFVETDMAASHLAGPDGDAIRAQSPFGRVAQPAEIAAAVVYLASPEAEWASGAVLDLNGASYLDAWSRAGRRRSCTVLVGAAGPDRKMIRAGRREDLATAAGDPAAGENVVELHQRPVRRERAPADRRGVADREPGERRRHVEIPDDHGRDVVGGQAPDQAQQLDRAEQPVGQVRVHDAQRATTRQFHRDELSGPGRGIARRCGPDPPPRTR